MAKKSKRPVEPWWYVLPHDRQLDAGEQSRFKLRPLTQAERMEATDAQTVVTVDAAGTRELRFRSFTQARELVVRCLVDTMNFPAGEVVPFPKAATREQREEYVALLEDDDVYAIGREIYDHSTVSAAEKNSSAGSLTPS